ncbi:MAG TPA: 3-oxoacyl-[acyl-carrier-protein] synthase III C-terminal domain-containing protein [Polyangiales bacterium]
MQDPARNAPSIAGSATALPRHRYDQRELAEIVRALLPELQVDPRVLERFFRQVGVKQRYLALPAEQYAALQGFGAKNRAWLEQAVPLAERAVLGALAQAGLTPSEVGMLMSTTVTGIAVPSLEARLMNRLRFSTDAKRIPLFGLGCMAGAAGLARASEYLRAFPDQAALFFSVELCSLTLQREDASVANLISGGLFGDGAAAVVLVGAEHRLAKRARQPRVVDSLSRFFPDTERAMGWDMVDGGFKIVLGREVPAIAREAVPELVDSLLAKNGLGRDAIAHWIAHPGGPAVMEGMRVGLGLPAERLEATRRSLEQIGNLSSASVLFLLDEFLRGPRRANEHALVLAMGPAFSAEGVLLQC